MITWFKNKKLSIMFDKNPKVGIRYINPSMSDSEKQSIKKFPFICLESLKVTIVDFIKHNSFCFTIPKNYCYDGASIPKFFWRVIGSNTDNSFLIPALIHDTLCEHHEYIDNNKTLATNVFNALLYTSDIKCIKRFFMKNSVALYQTLFSRWK